MNIELDGEDKRKKVDVKNEEGKKEKLPLYFDGESVSGKVTMVISYFHNIAYYRIIRN